MQIYVAAYLMEQDPLPFRKLNIGFSQWEKEVIEEFKTDQEEDQATMMIKLIEYIDILLK